MLANFVFMPRYYFDCEVDGVIAPDEEGLDLPSLRDVAAEVIQSATAIARDEFPTNGGNGVVVVRARDADGRPVMTARTWMTTTTE